LNPRNLTEKNMGKIIGIDLGTTNSVRLHHGGQHDPSVIENSRRRAHHARPSWPTRKTARVLVGASAKRQAVTNPKNTLYRQSSA
jgi:molecular chaperone DnaK